MTSRMGRGGGGAGGLRRIKDNNISKRAARPEFTPEHREKTIYIGNFDKRVTEYALIKMFEPIGRIVRVQYLWHMAGELRGTPRGYAFIEFSSKQEADAAQKKLDGKPILGRPLMVRAAEDRDYNSDVNIQFSTVPERRRAEMTGKDFGGVKMSTEDKIRAIEAKLHGMKASTEHKVKAAKKIVAGSPASKVLPSDKHQSDSDSDLSSTSASDSSSSSSASSSSSSSASPAASPESSSSQSLLPPSSSLSATSLSKSTESDSSSSSTVGAASLTSSASESSLSSSSTTSIVEGPLIEAASAQSELRGTKRMVDPTDDESHVRSPEKSDASSSKKPRV